jgi:hypothetical protein
MKMIALLEKLETDAFLAARRKIEEDRLFAIERKDTPEAKAFEQRKHLRQLRARTAAMRNELKLKHELKAELKRLTEISLQLQEESLTFEERQLRDTEIYRLQTLFSKCCPEASPEWREQANLEFQSRYSPAHKKV